MTETDITIHVSQAYTVPRGTKVLLAPTGVISGLKLPTGEVLKPWVVLELYEDAEGKEVCEDLSEDELNDLGVYVEIVEMDYSREVVGNLEEQ